MVVNIKRRFNSIKKRAKQRSQSREKLRNSEISYVPEKLILHVTGKCNLRCPSCYLLLIDKNFFDNKQHIDMDLYAKYLDKYGMHLKTITLGGGEPTLHPHLEQMIDMAHEYGISVSMQTNGTLITAPRRQGSLIDVVAKVDKLGISLDAFDAASYKANRGGTEKQWKAILSSLQLLKERDVEFHLTYIVSRLNVNEVLNVSAMAEEVQANRLVLQSFTPMADDPQDVLSLEDENVRDVFNSLLSRCDYSIDIRAPIVHSSDDPAHWESPCSQPWNNVVSDELGNIGYCCYSPPKAEVGNLTEGYRFNSDLMSEYRADMASGNYRPECKWCGVRYEGKDTQFKSKTSKWYVNDPFQIGSDSNHDHVVRNYQP